MTDNAPLQENSKLKEAWLRDAQEAFPVGTRVRVRESDLAEYLGATGRVIGHDIGYDGDWPLIRVSFDHVIKVASGKATHDRTHDGFYDEELEIIT